MTPTGIIHRMISMPPVSTDRRLQDEARPHAATLYRSQLRYRIRPRRGAK